MFRMRTAHNRDEPNSIAGRLRCITALHDHSRHRATPPPRRASNGKDVKPTRR